MFDRLLNASLVLLMKDHLQGGMLLNGYISVFNTKKLFYEATNLHLKFTASLTVLRKWYDSTVAHIYVASHSHLFFSQHLLYQQNYYKTRRKSLSKGQRN